MYGQLLKVSKKTQLTIPLNTPVLAAPPPPATKRWRGVIMVAWYSGKFTRHNNSGNSVLILNQILKLCHTKILLKIKCKSFTRKINVFDVSSTSADVTWLVRQSRWDLVMDRRLLRSKAGVYFYIFIWKYIESALYKRKILIMYLANSRGVMDKAVSLETGGT